MARPGAAPPRSGAAFQRRVTVVVTAVAGPAVALVLLYLRALLQLPPHQQRALVECVAVGLAVLAPSLTLLFQRLYAPIVRVLDRWAAGRASAEELREGYARVSALPARVVAGGVASWLGGGAAIAGATALRADDMSALTAFSIFAGLASGAVISELFVFFVVKRTVEPERHALAAAVGEPEAREGLVRRVGLARKTRVAFAVVTLGVVVFSGLVAVTSAGRAVEGFSVGVQRNLLARLEPPLDAATVARLEGEARALGVARHVLWLEPETLAVRAGDPAALSRAEREAIAGSVAATGDSEPFQSPNALAWRRLPGDGGVLVALLPWDEVAAGGARMRRIFAWVLLLSAALAWGVARMLSDDVGRAVGALERQAAAIAGGDLRRGEVFDGEDELGALARRFEGMAAALRGMVSRVAGTAERVETATGALREAAGSVSQATALQVEAVRSADGAMERIDVGVRGIAGSAEGLSRGVDESSGAVHELDAAGRGLLDTAGRLSARVESVSSAVEQMAASIREVARSADALAEASDATSGSMEQMAGSVRAVEGHAAETARLSNAVVGSAERGGERVAQTVAGMEDIRRETETAREVIAGLGARATEIGGILGVIDDVADETGLLALNAAIISAQAGEHGRAFAVVADQIKDLAERVLASTREIAQRIRAVQDETANAAAAIERGSRSVQVGVKLSAEAGASLEEITSAARESGRRVEGIVAAMGEQTQGAAHVVALMDQVRDGVERIRRASREQDRGNELILREAVDMRTGAQRVTATAREQQDGSARIREAFEDVRAAVGEITSALQEQSEACRQCAALLDGMSRRTHASESALEAMRGAIAGLDRDAEDLREGVRRFAIS